MVISSYYSGQRITINPRSIVSSPVYEGGNWVRSKAQRLTESNLKDNTHKGKLSGKARTKLFNAVNWLVDSAKWKRVYSKSDNKHYYFKVNFITLTIPQQAKGDIQDKLLQKLLHNFLTYARKYFYLRNYVWKVERGKLGKLHIHLTTDTFIHYKKLRDVWNRIMIKEGLVDEYFNARGHYDPNSTDVHATKKIKNLAGYLCKYMSKETGLDEKYKSRIWGCNYHLSKSNSCSLQLSPDEVEKECKCLMNNPIEFLELYSKPKIDGTKYFFGYFFKIHDDDWSKYITGKIKSKYNDHRAGIRANSANAPEHYLVIDEYVKIPVVEKSEVVSESKLEMSKLVVSNQGILEFI